MFHGDFLKVMKKQTLDRLLKKINMQVENMQKHHE